jgi:DNA invertase Pin-like site-specific DNA recombinase
MSIPLVPNTRTYGPPAAAASMVATRPMRCAIYTRKSTEEGLEQEFNSLDAQRESAEAYIASQRHEGWLLLPDRYDDGGFSGGTLERPALERLMKEVEAGKVDVVVVYKVDRLSRSLMDFAKLVQKFEERGVSFISVTQQFNTTTSMGRLTLNILLSFAQFEREIAAERIRDKVAAAKKKGKYTGGMPVLGYDVDRGTKRLVVNAEEAKTVRWVFARFLEIGSATRIMEELNERGVTTKRWISKRGEPYGGLPWNKTHLYRLLNNRVYVGDVHHKGTHYPGEHEAIIDGPMYDKVQMILAENHRARGNRTRCDTPAMLRGVIRCASCDSAMGPTYTRKNGRMYRYYHCLKATKRGRGTCPVRTVAAGEIEQAVVAQLRAVFTSPEIIGRTVRAALAQQRDEPGGGPSKPISEPEAVAALANINAVWEHLFPAEQERIVRLIVERIDVRPEGIDLRLRASGLYSIIPSEGVAH